MATTVRRASDDTAGIDTSKRGYSHGPIGLLASRGDVRLRARGRSCCLSGGVPRVQDYRVVGKTLRKQCQACIEF